MLILIAEDEFLSADEMGRALVAAGYRVVLASSAWQALRAVAVERPAVAIIDLALRDGLTGPELARLLAETGLWIVIWSGYNDAYRNDLLRGIPIVAHLSKPVPFDELLKLLRGLELQVANRGAILTET